MIVSRIMCATSVWRFQITFLGPGTLWVLSCRNTIRFMYLYKFLDENIRDTYIFAGALAPQKLWIDLHF